MKAGVEMREARERRHECWGGNEGGRGERGGMVAEAGCDAGKSKAKETFQQ